MITLRHTQPIRLTIEATNAQLAIIYQILLALVVIAGAVLIVSRMVGKVAELWRACCLSIIWPIATG